KKRNGKQTCNCKMKVDFPNEWGIQRRRDGRGGGFRFQFCIPLCIHFCIDLGGRQKSCSGHQLRFSIINYFKPFSKSVIFKMWARPEFIMVLAA
ncbi:hypothetical protein NPIL_258341, partial [Nephila pilipes]